MNCSDSNDLTDMASFNTDALVKIQPPDLQITPVGITPAQSVDGKVTTQIAGKGEGIFSDIVSTATMLFNTVKPSGGTASAVTAPAVKASAGGSNANGSTAGLSGSNGNILMTILWIAIAWFGLKALGILK